MFNRSHYLLAAWIYAVLLVSTSACAPRTGQVDVQGQIRPARELPWEEVHELEVKTDTTAVHWLDSGESLLVVVPPACYRRSGVTISADDERVTVEFAGRDGEDCPSDIRARAFRLSHETLPDRVDVEPDS